MKNKHLHYSARIPEKYSGLRNVHGQPETAFDMVNKYGTYEIQPTADSGNDYPQISQGLPKEHK